MKHIKLFEEVINEAYIDADAVNKLADEIHGELYIVNLKGKSVTVKATTTTKVWDDGVPVLKELARGKSRSVTFEPANSTVKVVHDYAHGWFYFTDFRKWYGLHVEDGYQDIEDLPFVNPQVAESIVNEATTSWNKMMKGVRAGGSGPWSLVAIENKKVVAQKIDIRDKNILPAHFEAMRKEHPKAKIHIEDAGGQVVWNEGVEITEASKSIVNEAKELDRDAMIAWIEQYMETVRTTEEFDGSVGGIWVSGENDDLFKGKKIYNYYGNRSGYELGVLSAWEKEINNRGWYSEWYDAGTVMIWPN